MISGTEYRSRASVKDGKYNKLMLLESGRLPITEDYYVDSALRLHYTSQLRPSLTLQTRLTLLVRDAI